jgi:hypothetical protein
MLSSSLDRARIELNNPGLENEVIRPKANAEEDAVNLEKVAIATVNKTVSEGLVNRYIENL